MNESNDLGGALVRRIGRAGLGVAVVFSLGLPLFAQEDSEVRWHNVGALGNVGVEEVRGLDLRLHLASSFLDNLEPDGWGVPSEGRSRLSADDFGHVVREVLEGQELEVEARSGMLRVVASEELQEQVAEIVSDMKAQFLRSVELEVFVLPASALTGYRSPVLTREEADGLLASHASLGASRKLGCWASAFSWGTKAERLC